MSHFGFLDQSWYVDLTRSHFSLTSLTNSLTSHILPLYFTHTHEGVSGFRMDAAVSLVEDELLRNEPNNPNWSGEREKEREKLLHIYTENLPETRAILSRMSESMKESFPSLSPLGQFVSEPLVYCEVPSL